jgi:threonine/homoserine/homoserine lactone efflux protein
MAALMGSLIAFTAAAALLTITPGLDTALVLRTAAVEGRRKALAAAIGIGFGCLAWAGIVALGLGALLAASELAYRLLKWVGAAYLVWLGVQLIRSRRTELSAAVALAPGGAALWFRRGVMTNLLNPKVGIFYISFLPQFIPTGANVPAMTLVLAAIHVLLGLSWFALLIGATAPLGRALQRPATIQALDRFTGGVFLLFAARLALSRD